MRTLAFPILERSNEFRRYKSASHGTTWMSIFHSKAFSSILDDFTDSESDLMSIDLFSSDIIDTLGLLKTLEQSLALKEKCR